MVWAGSYIKMSSVIKNLDFILMGNHQSFLSRCHDIIRFTFYKDHRVESELKESKKGNGSPGRRLL